jgi:hypothetical protein
MESSAGRLASCGQVSFGATLSTRALPNKWLSASNYFQIRKGG